MFFTDPYINVTRAVGFPIVAYVQGELVYAQETTFAKKEIAARGLSLLGIPTFLMTGAIDTIIGAGAGIVSIATLGMWDEPVWIAFNHLTGGDTMVANAYFAALSAINPKFAIGSDKDLISVGGRGFSTQFIFKPITNLANECRRSDHFLVRQFVSRCVYLALAIACLITRLLDALISVPAVLLSFITLGKNASLNNLASRTLQSIGIISDLFYCMIGMINP